MHDDDRPIGRLLTRREALALLGLSGAGLVIGCRRDDAPASSQGALPSCVVRPEQTEGPFFVDESLDRSDLRSDPATGEVTPGVPLGLTFKVSRIQNGSCAPLPGAHVDVWHCDARGVYSDVRDSDVDTVGRKFLRGYQTTGADGVARFTTIYPGWYSGRTVHVHFKIRSGAAKGGAHEFTSQLYFDDALTDRVHARDPYAAKGQRAQRNDGDGIFSERGRDLMLALAEDGAGYAGSFDVGLELG